MRPVRAVICGTRGFDDRELLFRGCDYHLRDLGIGTVISGGAAGADLFGEAWAADTCWPVRQFLPDYKRYGRYNAPKIRNIEMGKHAAEPGIQGIVLAFWDGYSGGTAHMIAVATALKLDIRVVLYKGQ